MIDLQIIFYFYKGEIKFFVKKYNLLIKYYVPLPDNNNPNVLLYLHALR